jgi:hypothetical protein
MFWPQRTSAKKSAIEIEIAKKHGNPLISPVSRKGRLSIRLKSPAIPCAV